MRYTGFLLYKLAIEAVRACKRQRAQSVPRRRGSTGSIEGDSDRTAAIPLLAMAEGDSEIRMVTSGAIRSELQRQQTLREYFSSNRFYKKCAGLLKFTFDFVLTTLLAGASFAKSYAFIKAVVDLIYRGIIYDDNDLSSGQIDHLRLTLRAFAYFGLFELASMLIWKFKFKTPVTHTSRFFEEPGEVFSSFIILLPRFVAFADNTPGDANLNRSRASAYLIAAFVYTFGSYRLGAYDNYHVRVSRHDRAWPLRFLSYLPFPMLMAAFAIYALDFLIPPETLESFSAEEKEALKFSLSGALALSSLVRIFAEKNVKRLMYREHDDHVSDVALKRFKFAKTIAIMSAFFLTGFQGLVWLDTILNVFNFSCSTNQYGRRTINDYDPACSFILILALLMAAAAGFDVYRNYSPSLTQAHEKRYPKHVIATPEREEPIADAQQQHRNQFGLNHMRMIR